MMQLILNSQKIWFYRDAVDFRKSIDGLVSLLQLNEDVNPMAGIFIFRNRSQDKLKLLAWHGNGFVLIYKRLEHGKFTAFNDAAVNSIVLNAKELSWLLAGLDWEKMRNWHDLSYDNFY